MSLHHPCALCPRRCGALRSTHLGRCGGGSQPVVARAALHHWEEPCISGTRGSGTVFFSGCGLGCVFCQNHQISRVHNDALAGKAMDTTTLADTYLSLQRQGAHNLNLVTATHYRPWVQQALAAARTKGFALPVVWNSSGYETEESMRALAPDVQIWLLDLKFHSSILSAQYANAPDYFEYASRAATLACTLAGPPRFDDVGLLQSGVVLRLPVLSGHRDDAKQLLAWMADTLPPGGFLLSLLRQYTPPAGLCLPSPLHRRLSSFEYRDVADTALRLGLEDGYTQQAGSATQAFVPPFPTGPQ